ncbi:MAG: hypothetical protein BWY31_01019 [Lentisphaerae bacterium ADurb.Bin242]|nr:MAG: hypothetical protein BWY31_01019 [Lentisphaerae bacterium ADurb.Bin242]
MFSSRISRIASGHPFWFCFLTTAVLLSLGVIGTGICKLDIRFTLMVEDMSRHGIGLFATLNGWAYPDYPSPYVIASWVTCGFGRWITLWTLTLPTILLGAYSIAMTLVIGEKQRKGLGVYAAALSFFSFEYLYVFSGFGIDTPVCAAGATMLYLLQHGRGSVRQAIAFSALLIFCFVIRGPIGLLLLGAASGGFLLTHGWKKTFVFGATGAVVLAGCLAGGYFLIHAFGGVELWEVFMEWQVGKRIEGGDYLYYFFKVIPSLAPLSIPMIALLVFGRKRLLEQPVFGWFGYIFLPMILLSIPGCKHLRYITLCIPAIALTGAWGILEALEGKWGGRLRDGFRLLDRVFPWLGILTLIGMVPVAVFALKCDTLPFGHWGLALACLLLLVFFRRERKTPQSHWLCLGAVFGVIYILGVNPLIAAYENSSAFVASVEKIRKGKLCMYEVGPDHEALKYKVLIPAEERARIVYMLDEPNPDEQYNRMFPTEIVYDALPLLKPEDIVVLRKSKLEPLGVVADDVGRKVEILLSGNLGHREYLAVKILPK